MEHKVLLNLESAPKANHVLLAASPKSLREASKEHRFLLNFKTISKHLDVSLIYRLGARLTFLVTRINLVATFGCWTTKSPARSSLVAS